MVSYCMVVHRGWSAMLLLDVVLLFVSLFVVSKMM